MSEKAENLHLTIRVDEQLRAAVVRAAALEDRPVSNWARRALASAARQAETQQQQEGRAA